MSSIPEHLKFTYEDYLLLPEDRRYEIIGGDLFTTPSPKRAHQQISRNLTTILWSYVKELFRPPVSYTEQSLQTGRPSCKKA